MISDIMHKFFLLTVCLLLPLFGYSQTQPEEKETSRVIVKNADNQIMDVRKDTVLYLNGNVALAHDSVFMYCDTAEVRNRNNVFAFGDVSMIKSDSIRVFADSIRFIGDSLKAYFYGNVVLEEGDNQLFTSYLIYDVENDVGIYTDTALLRSVEYELTSIKGFYYAKAKYVDFYEKVSVSGDDFLLITDSLRYFTDINEAQFLAPTRIRNGKQDIYSQYGWFDLDDNDAKLYGNAQFMEADRKGRADTILYQSNIDEIILKGEAYVNSDTEKGEANVITYNRKSEDLNLRGNAIYTKDDQRTTGENIVYNGKTERVEVQGTAVISKPPYLIQSESIRYDNLTGNALLDGAVSVQDTQENYRVTGDHVIFNDSTEYFKAFNDTGRPIFSNTSEDTLHLSGDTLLSYKEYLDGDTIRHIRAFNRVQILGNDISGQADSLSFTSVDSSFTLFYEPVMWADTSQYHADTIVLFLKDESIKKIELRNNAFITSTTDFYFYNQMSGKDCFIHFNKDSIERVDIMLDAKALYYMLDEEEAYMGVSKTESENMKLYFSENEIEYIKNYKEVKSDILPMEGTDHDALRLTGYKWLFEQRPTTIEHLME